MPTASLARFGAWIRATALVLLFALGAAIPGNVAISLDALCCQDEVSAHSDDGGCPDDDGGDRDCDCPLGCNTCCSGSLARAIAPASSVQIEAPTHDVISMPLAVVAAPPRGVHRDILHVPKPAS